MLYCERTNWTRSELGKATGAVAISQSREGSGLESKPLDNFRGGK